MGLLALNRLMSVQRERERERERRRRRQHGQIRDVKIALLANGKVIRKGLCHVRSPFASCQQDGSPHHQGHQKRSRYSGPDLPEDIWRQIHFMMPLQDAACVSHAFLSSWRSRPDITFTRETLGLNKNLRDGKGEIARDFNSKADQILKNRSGTGLKALKIDFCGYNADTYSFLSNWLETAITPELEELTVHLFPKHKREYSFPCSLLCNGRGSSIQHLKLAWCTFSNIAELYSLRNLTSLYLHNVRITGSELGRLFSNSTALERLELSGCYKIVRLKIPCLLQRLGCLRVSACEELRMIECKAPNISSFHYSGLTGEFSLGESSSLQLKDMMLGLDCIVFFALAELPFIAPNLEALSLYSNCEVPNNTAMVSKTFLHLKHLSITLTGDAFSPDYDCFSAVSFLDAAPSLETLRLGVTQLRMKHEPFDGEPSPQNQIMGTRRHSSLKSVKFTGFCSAKSLVELTCYILDNATSLDCLTLDTSWGCFPRCFDNEIGKCQPLTKNMIKGWQNALLVIRARIEGKVPPSVKFNVLGLCSKCHNA